MVHYPQIHREFKGHPLTQSNDVRLEGLHKQYAAIFSSSLYRPVDWVEQKKVVLCVSGPSGGQNIQGLQGSSAEAAWEKSRCPDHLCRVLRSPFCRFGAHAELRQHSESSKKIILLFYFFYLCCMCSHWCYFCLFYFIFILKKELVLQAVQKDQEGERSAALSLYCSALEYFVPAIYCKNYYSSPIFCLCIKPFDNPLTLLKQIKLADSKVRVFPLPPQTRQTDSVKMPSGRRWAWKHCSYLHLDYSSVSLVYF